MELIKTHRGFSLIEFTDTYGSKCSLQKSSSAEYDRVWLGVDDVEPKIMASQAASLGVVTTETTGWVPYLLPEAVILSSRMHLSREQAQGLIKHLQTFVDTGNLE